MLTAMTLETWFPSSVRQGFRFLREQRAIAAVEFAIVLPLLLVLALGSSELANYMRADQRMQVIAQTAGQLLSQSSSGSVNYVDVTFARDTAMAIYPDLLTQAAAAGTTWTNIISISISSIQFSLQVPGCTVACAYYANVAWSGGTTKRPCGTHLTPATDTTAPSSTTLPTDAFGPGSMIVVDVVYNYVPLFGTNYLPAITIRRSSYIQPRYVAPTTYIKYSVVSGDNGIASSCAGY